MISPESRLKSIWDVWIMFLTTYSAVELPARLVLHYTLPYPLDIFNWSISGFFLLDVILNFRTTIRLHGKPISDPGKVARHYLTGWFLVDFLSALPLELLGASIHRLLRVLRLLRLLRLARLAQFLRRLGNKMAVNPMVIRLTVMVFWILLVAHWIACIWIAIGGCGNETDLFRRYLRSIYWAFTTLGTVGYGDILPITNAQTLYALFVEIIGAGMYGYIIGNIATVIANLDIAKANFSRKMDQVNALLQHREIPLPLQRRVREYYHYLWESRKGYDEVDAFIDLPTSLQAEISLHINREIIEKVPLFQGAKEECLRDIVVALRPIVYMPGDFIMRAGEIGDRMFFISRGEVEVISTDGTEVYATLTEGNFFGEMALLFSAPRNAGVRAVDYCDLYTLDKATFDRILGRYPEFAEKIHRRARSRQERIQGRWEE